MGEKRVAFQSFDHSNDAIVATNSQVIALGNIVSQNNSRRLADSREHCQQNATFK
jgi:glycerophosphoryl diester phosphodiesterase